jgi:hypothetical protein
MEETAMTAPTDNNALVEAGMYWLREQLGALDAETFITAVRDARFHYTEWRRDNLWTGMELKEVLDLASRREREGTDSPHG